MTLIAILDKPEIVNQPSRLKFATDAGDTGKIVCRSQASPLARYAWSRAGSPINTNTTGKYYSAFKQVSFDYAKFATSTIYILLHCDFKLKI